MKTLRPPVRKLILRARYRMVNEHPKFIYPEFLVISPDVAQVLENDGSFLFFSNLTSFSFAGNHCFVCNLGVSYYNWFYTKDLIEGNLDHVLPNSLLTRLKATFSPKQN